MSKVSKVLKTILSAYSISSHCKSLILKCFRMFSNSSRIKKALINSNRPNRTLKDCLSKWLPQIIASRIFLLLVTPLHTSFTKKLTARMIATRSFSIRFPNWKRLFRNRLSLGKSNFHNQLSKKNRKTSNSTEKAHAIELQHTIQLQITFNYKIKHLPWNNL
jgi:hypothetical protein